MPGVIALLFVFDGACLVMSFRSCGPLIFGGAGAVFGSALRRFRFLEDPPGVETFSLVVGGIEEVALGEGFCLKLSLIDGVLWAACAFGVSGCD